MLEQLWLKCEVSQGQFAGEFAVRGRTFDNTGFSLFTSADDLDLDQAPTGNEQLPGRLCVDVLDRQGELVLVRLPQATLENGRTVTVRRSQLEEQAVQS
jgi:hypothetical protein